MPPLGALQRRLLVVVLVALAPIVTLSGANLILNARQQRLDLLRATTETMRAMVGAVDTELDRLTTVLEVLAVSSSLQRGNLRDFQDTVGRAKVHDPSWLNIVLTDPTGKELVNVLRPDGPPRPETPARPDAFPPVVRERRPTIGPLVPGGPIIGTPAFGIDVPVMRGSELRYVLTGVVSPDAIRAMIHPQRVPPNAIVSILDPRGNHVARSREHEQWLGKPAAETLQGLMTRAPEGAGPSRTVEGQEIYVAFSRSPASGWVVAAEVPRETIDGPVRRSYMTVGVGLGLSLALGLLASLLVARSVSRPVEALRLATQALGRGERPAAPRSMLPEVREVADALVSAHAARERQLEAERAARAEAEAANRAKDELLAARQREDVSAHRLAAIVDSSDDAIISKTLDGVVTSWNPAAERMFGYPAAEAIGRHITLIIPPERLAEEDEVLARIRSGRKIDHFDTVRVAKDGRLIDISLTVSPVRGAAGEIVGASKIARDISERRRLEAERAQSLAAAQAARAEAEQANRAKDEFLAMLGHELRNPLGAITSALRVVDIWGLADERGVKAREIITRQIRSLVRLVDDLLDVGRLTTGKIALRWVPVDLGAIARRTVAAGAADETRRVKCVTRGPVWIEADETRIEQIVSNLVGNALKFTPAGGRITVDVSAAAGEAILRVEDTGVGITPDLLPRIFDLFVQGETELHRPLAGLGIGLTLVRRLVDLHGGRIEAESDGPGRGSAFTVRFPLIAPPTAGAASVPAAAEVRGRRRVLIVEDNDDAREMLRYLLERVGHEVSDAADGPSGLDRALSSRPDAAVIDVGLPGLDGYELARRIRAAGRGEMLLIAMTGYGQTADRQRGLEAGFDAYLTKPIEVERLAELIGTASSDGPRPEGSSGTP
jgi:PAS domain S-box-containing protein